MKKNGILHKDLNELIGSTAHGDAIIISDAGFAIPENVRRIELAIKANEPDIIHILDLIKDECIIEKIEITEECRINNKPHYDDIVHLMKDEIAVIEEITHQELQRDILPNCRAVVRTGSFKPYGNVVIYPGIDAPKWFERKGVTVPDFYKNRVPEKK